jgi:hypothetical protein
MKKIFSKVQLLLIAGLVIVLAGAGTIRHLFGDTLTLAGYKITGIKNGASENNPNYLITQSGVNSAIGAAVEGSLSLATVGGVSGSVSSGQKTTNTTLLNNLIANAGVGEKVVIPYGDWRFNGNIRIPHNWKRPHLEIFGNVYFDRGFGFVLSGYDGIFDSYGLIHGGNTGATDSASYNLYAGDGVYLKNCFNWTVRLTEVTNCRNGVRVGAVNPGDSLPPGSQYNKIYFQRISYNYRQIWNTTSGTANNYSNSNYYFGGQIGRGLVGELGGTFGVAIYKDSTSGQTDNSPFNYCMFIGIGFEGIEKAIYCENADYNHWLGGRWEGTGAIEEPIYFKTLGSFNCMNNIVDMQGIYERYIMPNGMGIGTEFPQGMITESGGKSGDFNLPLGVGQIGVHGDYHISIWNESENDLIALGGFDGNFGERYFAMTRRSGVSGKVPFELNDTTVTVSSMSVPSTVSHVFYDYSAGVGNVNLPAAGSYRRRIVVVKNINATQNITVKHSAVTIATLLPSEDATFYSRGGVEWEIISQ